MKTVLRQCWVVLPVLLNLMTVGFHFGYPTRMLRDLRASNSEIPLSLETESWIVSAIAITCVPSFILTVPVLQSYGRRAAHLFMVAPSIMAYLLMYYARNVASLLAARLMVGFSTGSSIIVTAIIIGEMTSPDYRGTFLNAKNTATVSGVLFVHVIETFFDWRTTALIGLILPCVSFLMTCTWPESPAWLAYKGRFEECEVSFHWLRGNTDRSNVELQLLMEAQRNRRHCDGKRSSTNKCQRIVSQLAKKDFQKPTWIVFFVFVIMDSSGRHSFPPYAVTFISAFTGDNTNTMYYILIVDSVIVLASMASCIIVKFFPRRTLLLTSGCVSCVILASICLCLFLKSRHITSSVWLHLTLLCLYFIVINLGTTSMAMSLLGEIYPLEHRGLGTLVTGVWSCLSLLSSQKLTPTLIRALDVHGTFLIYVTSMAASLLFLYFFLPETEGKSLQEIEEYFIGVPLKVIRTADEDDELLHPKKEDQNGCS